jgi:NDP-sugar pyrophosphorylase family protein
MNIQHQFDILHDQGLIKCVVGLGTIAHSIKDILGDVEQVSTEHVMLQSPEWIAERQFLLGISNVKVKKQVVEYLDRSHAHYFSLVGKQNNIFSYNNIGVGTFINYCNELLSDPKVGNHCIVTAYCQLGHNVVIGDFCHISAYTYINNAHLGTGNILGTRSAITGSPLITTVDYCNFIINSVVNKDVTVAGTYFGNRKLSDQSSLEHQIL